MKYGLPYMGSKNAIVPYLIKSIPSAENFYDLFAGGCAVTHGMLLQNKFKHYVINDLNAGITELFINAINGKYKDEKRWISREDFKRLKDVDMYVAMCWSFGNKGTNYLFSQEVEEWKKALWYARKLNDTSLFQEIGIITDGSRSDIKKHKEEYKMQYIKWYLKKHNYPESTIELLKDDLILKIKKEKAYLQDYLLTALKKSGLKQSEVDKKLGTQMSGHYFGKSQWAFPTEEEYKKMQKFLPLEKDYMEIYGLTSLYQSLERLQSLQSLESLERLQSLESLERLERFNLSYEEVPIKPNSVLYCDIPYENTAKYVVGDFDHKKFYNWANEQKELVIISSYEISDDRFMEIDYIKKRSLLGGASQDEGTNKNEKLFIPKHQKELYEKMVNRKIIKQEHYEQLKLL